MFKSMLIARRTLAAVLAVCAASGFAPSAAAAECGTGDKITIAEMTWASAGMLAHLTRRILADGYGCQAEIVPGDTVPTATSMLAKGNPHIAPELWVSTAAAIWDKIQAKGNVYKASDTFTEGGLEGWWIPDYVARDYPIKSVDDLRANAKLFADASNPDKGRIYGCPPGWGCEIININLFKALRLDDAFELFSPGSGENLKASIARKVTRKEPVLAYYWGPTDVLGKYNLVRLQMPPYDADKFTCLTDKDCANPQASDWKAGEVAVAVVAELRDKAPAPAAFLAKMSMPNGKMNQLLAWGSDEKASNDEMAVRFLKDEEAVWSAWVPAEVAAKVKAAL